MAHTSHTTAGAHPLRLTLDEVRRRFLAFMERRGHVIIPSAPLLPKDDPTTLFTGSGMQPLVPYLLGEPHPAGRRLANSQKCFRQMDIEEVGDNRHTTFFEMLGNWSLGDYFKREQLIQFFTFLTDASTGLGLPPERLFVTVFAGDEQIGIPRDEESIAVWQELFHSVGIDARVVDLGTEETASQRGMMGGRIFTYGATKNWWSRAGVPEAMPAGEPGGPDSEVFYDFGELRPDGTPWHDPERFGPHCHPNCDCGRFVEIGNSVFMEYLKREDGSFGSLPTRNVDFGGGLERLTMATHDVADVFMVAHLPLITALEQHGAPQYGSDEDATRSMRIVADHMKAATFLIADGALPSTSEAGYVVRRLIRRSVVKADALGVGDEGLRGTVDATITLYRGAYPELEEQRDRVEEIISAEVTKFRRTLSRGTQLWHRTLERLQKDGVREVPGSVVFQLATTYGFPVELVREMAQAAGVGVDEAGYHKAMARHREVSRAGITQKFKGGLADHSTETVRYHTATHLLHAALREVLGPHAVQRGSNITPERLRFDVAHPTKITEEQLRAVEARVNEWIAADLPVQYEDVPLEEARQRGAIGLFGERYPDTVRIYLIGDPNNPVSIEFCGGPHVKRTGELGHFRIVREEALGAGVRRIRAILE